MSVKRPRWVHPFLLIPGLLLGLSAPAAAQEIDTGAFERLLGQPVTTSATGMPQPVSDVPVNMVIITQAEIRRSGAVDIPDVLQWVAGVDVRRYGIADAEVGIRGYNQPYNPRLLVLLNGRQVYLDDYGHVNWSAIPVQLSDIRQIEVIKGPNSALYGFNAASGVINIITFDPLYDDVNTASVTGGTQGYLGGSLVATTQDKGHAGLRVSLGGFHADEYAAGGIPAGDAAARQPPRVGTFDLDGRAKLAPGVEVVTEVSTADSRIAEKDFAGAFDTSFTRTNSVRVGLTADTPIGLLSIKAYRNQEMVTVAAPSLAMIPDWVREDVYVVQASDLLKLDATQTVRIGFEYRNNSATAPGFLQGTIGYNVFAADAMWNWQITPRLTLTNALRVDDMHLHYTGTLAAGTGLTIADYDHAGFAVPSFNSGLVFKPTELDTFRFMAARGVQLPSLVDFGLQFPFGTFAPAVIAGNPNLQPSTVDNVELDYDRDILSIGSTLRTAVFAQHNRNLIGEAFAAQPFIGPTGLPVLLASNVGSSDAVGVEIGLKGKSTSGIRWNFSYAFVSTTDNTSLNRNGLITSAIDYAHSVPRHVVIAGVGYTRGPLDLDLMGRWQSSYQDFESSATGLLLQPVEIRNYLSLSARIGYRLTKTLAVSVAAQQFNAPRLLQVAGPPVERRVLATVRIGF